MKFPPKQIKQMKLPVKMIILVESSSSILRCRRWVLAIRATKEMLFLMGSCLVGIGSSRISNLGEMNIACKQTNKDNSNFPYIIKVKARTSNESIIATHNSSTIKIPLSKIHFLLCSSWRTNCKLFQYYKKPSIFNSLIKIYRKVKWKKVKWKRKSQLY